MSQKGFLKINFFIVVFILLIVGVGAYLILVKKPVPIIQDEDNRQVLSLECNNGETYKWQNGADSVKKYLEVKKSLDNLTDILNCKCEEPNCYSCRIDGYSWYRIFYPNDRFIVSLEYDLSGDRYLDAFDYSIAGQKINTLCNKILVRNSPNECRIVAGDEENNRIDFALDEIYFSGRKSVIQYLNSMDKFKNQLFDLYVRLGKLKPDDKILNIYQIIETDKKASDGVYIFENKFLVPQIGGEFFAIEQYSFDGERLGPYCENTWAIGGGGDTNPNCKLPKDSITTKNYLDLIEKACQ